MGLPSDQDVDKRSSSLKPLRTKAEVSTIPTFTHAYVLKVAAPLTAQVLKLIDAAIGLDERTSLAHLRRVVQPDYISAKIRGQLGIAPAELGNESGRSAPELLVLLCRSKTLAQDDLCRLLDSISDETRQIHLVLVPCDLPDSEEQAARWSDDFWPTNYRKYRPLGPQLHVINAAALEILPDVRGYMQLAAKVADAGFKSKLGKRIGAVVVERGEHGARSGRVQAAAGDARWYLAQQQAGYDATDIKPEGGNVMAHAVMRAIAMIATKRRGKSDSAQPPISKTIGDAYTEQPLTTVEQTAIVMNDTATNGYLCLGLELYVTHEPCVMCCMALLHSRFERVIFAQSMPKTGGLLAERTAEPGGLTYGLSWLPELNWKFLTWQWQDDGDSDAKELHEPDLHA